MSVFRLAKFKIKVKAVDKIELPEYAGSVFRGSFGHAFKKVACITLSHNCEACEQRSICPYIAVFETEYPESVKNIKRIQKPPKPYIIEPPMMNLTSFEAGKDIYFGLTLIGKAINYLPYFIFTFKQMGKNGIGRLRGKFLIEDVQAFVAKESVYKSIFTSDEQKVVLNSEDFIISFNNSEFIPENKPNLTESRIKFLTPVNIIKNKSPKHDLDFYTFFSRLISRINALSLLYCNGEFINEPYELIEKSKNIDTGENMTSWFQYNRYSTKQKQSLIVGGYLGEVTYRGDLKDFYPCLQIGKYVHTGKYTTSGLGKYEIVE